MRSWLFQWLHWLICRQSLATASLAAAAAAALGIYGAANMRMITDQDRLLSEDLEYHRRYLDFLRRFGDLEFLYVLVEGGTREDKIRFAELLADRISRSPHIRRVFYAFDKTWARDHAVYFADDGQFNELYGGITGRGEDIERLAGARSLDLALHELTRSLQAAMAGGDAAPGGTDELETLTAALREEAPAGFAELRRLGGELDRAFSDPLEYQWLADGEYLLMLIMPDKDYSTLGVIEEPLREIRACIRLTKEDVPACRAGLTGRPALQADEMRTTNKDMQNASLIALAGVTVLFSLFFREWARPLLAVIALLMAMGWTYGFVALTLGHLNLLSLVFALVLIGLGIDFGIHFLHRYQEEFGSSGDAAEAVGGALRGVGRGIVTGALTSSAAFLLALATDFLGLAELGFVAGSGIVFCLIAMLVVLPALLYLYDRHIRPGRKNPEPLHLIGLRHASRHPWVIATAVFAVTAYLVPRAGQITFNDNLLELQADGLESVEYEHKLLDNTETSTWFCAFLRQDMEGVREIHRRLEAIPSVAGVSSLADALPDVSAERMDRVEELRAILRPFADRPLYEYRPNPSVRNDLRNELDALFEALRMREEWKAAAGAARAGGMDPRVGGDPRMADAMRNGAAPPGMAMPEGFDPSADIPEIDIEPALLDQLRELRELLSGPDAMVRERLERAHNLLFREPRAALKQAASLVAAPPPGPEDLPDSIRALYIGREGSLLVMAHPLENIWETEAMRTFVSDMRAVDPEVTGVPIQVYESSLLMRESFKSIALYSVIAVMVLVFLDFRTLKSVIFVLGPLLLGIVWLIEIMGLTGVQLNLANFFAIPILIGIGVDNAVHLYHRYLETGDIEKSIFTTGTTLTLTTMTTITGFGSLYFASHKGLESLGALMALGSFTCWISCVVFLPVLIKCFHPRPKAVSAG